MEFGKDKIRVYYKNEKGTLILGLVSVYGLNAGSVYFVMDIVLLLFHHKAHFLAENDPNVVYNPTIIACGMGSDSFSMDIRKLERYEVFWGFVGNFSGTSLIVI